jgi:hypothetical protein
MDIYGYIKHICYEALNSGDSDKHEHTLRDILFFIAKEEENAKLRFQYYDMLKSRNRR